MSSKEDYLHMQRREYDTSAKSWSLTNRDPVVGFYDAHNACLDYDVLLFRNFETKGKVALEYGCGPGRNLIRYKNRFARIDGVDIGEINLEKAKINLAANDVTDYNLFLTPGDSIPVADETYDVVFSVICLQHICCHIIRYNIMKDAYRVLKKGGYLCFQMGFGKKDENRVSAEYYEDAFNAKGTNSSHDVTIRNEDDLKNDLTKIGFRNYTSVIRPSNMEDQHTHWIWVQVQK